MSGGKVLVVALGLIVVLVVVAGLLTLGGDPGSREPGSVPEEPEGATEAAVAPGAIPEERGEYTVVGRVVRYGAETPVAGAKVTVGELPADSDEDGRFTVGPLEEGSATLKVVAEGFAKLTKELDVSASGADLGDLYLRSDTVLEGIVETEDGKPIPGAVVKVLERNVYHVGTWYSIPEEDQFVMGVGVLDKGEDPPGISTGTGQDGKFRFEGLSPGKYFVTALAPGRVAGEIDEVELPAGGQVSVRLPLAPAVSIAGTVIDVRRNPVAGARVMGCRWNRTARLPYTAMLMTTSGPDGRFRLDNLANGVEHFLVARAPDGKLGVGIQVDAPTEDAEIQVGPRFAMIGSVLDEETGEPVAGAKLFTLLGYATSGEDGRYKLTGVVKSTFFRYVWITKDGYEGGQHEIELGASVLGGPVLSQDFKLTKLKPGTLHITARTLTGQPIEGVTAVVMDWGREREKARGTTGPTGEAEIEGVPPGGGRVLASKEGFVWVHPWEHEGRSGTRVVESNWMRMEPEGRASMELVFAETAEASGKVRDPSGKPLAGVKVSFGGENPGTETNEKGEFTLGGLPKDSATFVFLTRDGYVPKNHTVTAGSGAPAEIVMNPAAIVAGRVLDEEDRPLARVRVVIRAENYQTDERTEADGKFRFGGLPPGTYSIAVHRDGFAPRKLPPLTLAESDVRDDLEIRLPVGVEARVEPVLPDGSPADARVVVYGPMDGPEDQRVTTSEGRRGSEEAIMFRLQPGRYRFIVTSLDRDQDLGAVEVERDVTGSGGEIRIALAGRARRILVRPILPPGGIARGLNLRRTEPPVPDVSFWLWGDEVWSETEGVMKTPALPEGKYKIGVYFQEGENGAWRFKEVEDVEPGPTPVTLDFTK